MNVLVVGTGSIAKRHIKNLLELEEVTRILLYSSRSHFPVDLDGDRISIQKSLRDLRDIDFAVVADATHKHVATAMELAGQGIHMFIEKPLSHNYQDARKLADLATEKNIRIFVGYNMRFLGVIRLVKDEIAKGSIGKIYFVQIEAGQFLPEWRPNRDYRDCYSAHKDQGGGVGLDLSHELDYMIYLFGFPVAWKIFSNKVSNLEINSDDIFTGLFEFKEGFICSVHLDYLQRPKKRTLRIVGSEGAIECDLIGKRMVLSKTDNDPVTTHSEEAGGSSFFDMDSTYKLELQSFMDSIKRGSKPEIDLADGLRVLELLKT